MTKRRKSDDRNQANKTKSATPKPQPLKPRRKLMISLAFLYAAWIATLIVLYITTIVPLHHRA
jgi:hypothetical protein